MIIGNGVEILHEDEYILVCKKPAGMATQTRQMRAKDMVSVLKKYLYMKNPKNGEPYLGVIHRLDQPVSGILIFAKDSKSAAILSNAMQGADFGKHYAAILNGIPSDSKGQLVDYMVKSPNENFSKICDANIPDAKKAILNYAVVETPSTADMALFPFITQLEENMSYVHIQLETGRHHQIRVQTSHMGAPIIGDTKYGEGQEPTAWQKIALCAYKLEFIHPYTNKKMTFSLNV